MTNPDISLIAALLDRSGSMQQIADDTRGGFDAYIAKVRADRENGEQVFVSLAQFDNEYDDVYLNRPIDEVPPLDLQPRGMTALLDALGRFITSVGASLAALDEDQRPGDVTVLVMTDGMENASVEWKVDAVKALIEQQKNTYDWEFVFLGANIDAVSVGTSLGFDADRSMTYAASSGGVSSSYQAVADLNVRKRAAYRSAAPGAAPAPVAGFSDDERRRARGE